METVQSYFGCAPPARTYGRKTNSGLLIGIEIELEKVFLVKDILGWKQVKDGSLKDAGLEFTIPVWHTHAKDFIENLFDSLDKPNASPRCSVHIHTNVCSFTEDQLKCLIILYTIFERALYRYSGKRWNNNYCVPVQTWGVGLDLLNYDFKNLKQYFPKYSGLNIIPEGPNHRGVLGTVEFRHMAGNKNPMYIVSWINILANLVQYAQKQDLQELLDRIRDMRESSQYWILFKDVFKELSPALNYSTFDKDVEKGITFTKLITQL